MAQSIYGKTNIYWSSNVYIYKWNQKWTHTVSCNTIFQQWYLYITKSNICRVQISKKNARKTRNSKEATHLQHHTGYWTSFCRRYVTGLNLRMVWKVCYIQMVPGLKLQVTARLPLRIDGWETILSFWGPAISSGAFAVSFKGAG